MAGIPQFKGGETVKRAPRRDIPGPVEVRGIRPVENDVRPALAAVRGVRIDPAAFAAPAEGMARMGDAVSKVGDVFGKLAEQQQKAINIRHLAEGEAAMQSAQDEAAAAIAKEPDETKWEGIAGSVWDKASAGWNREEFAPDVADTLGARAITARSRMIGETKVASARQSFKRTAGVFEDLRLKAVDGLNLEGAHMAVDQLEQGGFVSKDEATRLRIQSKDDIERETARRQAQAEKAARENDLNTVASAIDQDPWQAESLLSGPPGSTDSLLPTIDASDKLRIKGQIREAQHFKQNEARDAIRDAIVSGQADDKEIERQGTAARMGAEDIAQLKQFRQKVAEAQAQSAPIDWVKAGQLSKDIQDFDPDAGKPEDAVKVWGSLMQRVETDATGSDDAGRQTQSALRQRLWQKHPYHERRRPDPDLGDIGGELDDLLDVHERAGAFGPAEEKVTVDGFQKTRVPADTAKQSATMRRILKIELKKEAQADPEHFNQPGAVDDWISKRLRVERVSAGASNVISPILPPPGAINTRKLSDILAQ